MSRHTLDRQRNYGSIVVGYDRPIDNFFLQVWSRSGNLQASHVMYDHADVIAALKHVKVKATDEVLSELASQLEAEALGLAETNTCKDWRIIEEQPV